MAAIDLNNVSLVDLREMYLDAERDIRRLEGQVDDLKRANSRLERELDEAFADADASVELQALAEALDMIVAGDMSGALHTIRRACDDAKVQAACDRAFSKLKCLVPA